MTPSTRSRAVELSDAPAPPNVRIVPSARSNSWEDVSDLMASLGAPLDEWQDQVLEAAMGERADGKWASKFVGLSAPRQNGKSQLIVARALAGVLLFGEKMIIISAHEVDTARQIWKRMIDIIESNPSLEARVTGRMDAISREFLSFGRGADRQEIRLKARGKSSVRGFSGDCLLLDEAQILEKAKWGAIVPTMSARENPQMWLLGTPPTREDDPFGFEKTRMAAMGGKARHCWMEYAADPGDDLDDPVTWMKANPSPRVPVEAIEDDRSALDDEQFQLERLGIWMDFLADTDVAITPELWGPGDPEATASGRMAFGVYVNIPRTHSAIGAATMADDGSILVETVPAMRGREGDELPGTAWIPGRVAELAEHGPEATVVDSHSSAASLLPAFEDRGVEITTTNSADMAKACGLFYDLLVEGRIRHLGAPGLSNAALSAKWRELADSRAWDRKNKSSDITQLVAVTLAVWGLLGVSAPTTPSESAYNADEIDFMTL